MEETIYQDEETRIRFFKLVERLDKKMMMRGQLVKFVQWLYDHYYFRNISVYDFLDCISYGDICLPLCRYNKIAVGIDIYPPTNYVKIGLDPGICFDKVSKCSVTVKLPLSKREDEQLYRFLEKIENRKSDFSRTWFRMANSCYYGEFAKFGE